MLQSLRIDLGVFSVFYNLQILKPSNIATYSVEGTKYHTVGMSVFTMQYLRCPTVVSGGGRKSSYSDGVRQFWRRERFKYLWTITRTQTL